MPVDCEKFQTSENQDKPATDIPAPVPAVTSGSGISSRSLFLPILFSLLVIALVTGAFYMGRNTRWLPVGNDKPPEITEQIVLERIRQVSKFVSAEYFMADVIEYENKEFISFFDKKMLIIAKAKVLAGFDFDKGIRVTLENRDGKKQAVHIMLPPPEIISVEPEYRYYDIRGNIPAQDHTLILAEAKSTLRRSALRAGILDKARESAQTRLTWLFPLAEVSVTFSQETKKHNETDGYNHH